MELWDVTLLGALVLTNAIISYAIAVSVVKSEGATQKQKESRKTKPVFRTISDVDGSIDRLPPVPNSCHVVTDGQYAFFSGALPFVDGATEVDSDAGVTEQTHVAIRVIRSGLGYLGSSMNSICFLTVQLGDISDLEEVDRALSMYWMEDEMPARSVVGGCALQGNALVQFSAIARHKCD